MELYATDMFFRGDNDKQREYDCCVHGKVCFRIDDTPLCDSGEWCISASAFRFLKTLFENHSRKKEDFLIPCCGNMMVPSEDKTTVTIIGCNNGIDFDIVHERDIVFVKTTDKTYRTSFEEYKTAVLSFAKQIGDFYNSNVPRIFINDYEKEAFYVFLSEFNAMYDKASRE